MKLSADHRSSLGRRIIRAIKDVTGLPEAQLMPLSDQVVYETLRALEEEFKGEQLYLRRRDPSARERVRAEWNGRNREELMARYQISRSTFYEYIATEAQAAVK